MSPASLCGGTAASLRIGDNDATPERNGWRKSAKYVVRGIDMRRLQVTQVGAFRLSPTSVAGIGALWQQSDLYQSRTSLRCGLHIQIVDIVRIVVVLTVQFLEFPAEG